MIKTACYVHFGLALLFGWAVLSAHAHAQTIEDETWPATPTSTGDIDLSLLSGLANDIRGGKFQKIGSVLIARHGKPLYEEYFDGDADTLRDTRSVTKSVTDVLVGIAIDEHALRGVQERQKLFTPLHIRNVEWVYSPLNVPHTGGGLRLS